MKYTTLIKPYRVKITSVQNRGLTEELSSDRSRIIYSSSFRRLQRKAQVFSLEDNSAVRSRLTHSLEVADVGRLIAQKITNMLLTNDLIVSDLQIPFIYAVENACLMHDIGNPPFGHFGEKAIRIWFKENWESCLTKATGFAKNSDELKYFQNNYLPDFMEFDGNPQGLRLVTRLQRDRDCYGMNLTYTTLLSYIKYTRSPKGQHDNALNKKPGFFITEEDIIEKAKLSLGINPNQRYPLAYIMEAADDISYCLSDIEDGIEKGIISPLEFFKCLEKEWEKESQEGEFPLAKIPNIDENNSKQHLIELLTFKTTFTRNLIDIASTRYIENHDKILRNEVSSLLDKNSVEGKALQSLKNVAKKRLFRSKEAEGPELAGYKIISGILDCFIPILECKMNDFKTLINSDLNNIDHKLDLHVRLFDRLPQKHVLAYIDQLDNSEDPLKEWFLRCHLVTDYISGMTDLFALETYQLLHGIRIV